VSRVVAVVQARCGSERLPGKVLLPLAGRPVVEHVLRSAQATPSIDDVVLATTTGPADDELAALGEALGVRTTRGSEDDVLGRFVAALDGDPADVVVRLTADNPLLDPAVTGAVVRRFAQGDCDYASNNGERSWPRGLDCEVLSRDALARADRDGQRPEDREHVTFHVRTHPQDFRLVNVRAPVEQEWPELRLSLDTAEDLALLERVFDALYDASRPLGIDAVIAWLRRHPEVVALNADVQQKPTLGTIL
jgi:spore coat polysaccharide biosynthesis protein SpsF